MAHIGIDFGFTNCSVAIFDGGPRIVYLDGRATMPAAVAFHKGELVVGRLAQELASIGDEVVLGPKRYLGTDKQVTLGGTIYSAVDLCALILRALKERAESELDEAVAGAVLAHPAHFNFTQISDLRRAAEQAGLTISRLLPEPVAVSAAYASGGDERHLVVDMGGAALDCTVIDGFVDKILGLTGDSHLGGDDFDARIVERMLEQVKREQGVELQPNACRRRRLLMHAERGRIHLSQVQSSRIAFHDALGDADRPVAIDFELKRGDFEQWTADLVGQVVAHAEEAMHKAALDRRDIDQVLLSGGTTLTPIIQERLEHFFGRKPARRVDPRLAVALGAARAAHELDSAPSHVTAGPEPPPNGPADTAEIAPAPAMIASVLPRSLMLGFADGRVNLIAPQGAELPMMHQFEVAVEPGTPELRLEIYEGGAEPEIPYAPFNANLGTVKILLLPPNDANQRRLQVELEVDESRTIRMRVQDAARSRILGETALTRTSPRREHLHLFDRIDRDVHEAGDRLRPDEKIRINRSRQRMLDLSEEYAAQPAESTRQQIITAGNDLIARLSSVEQRLLGQRARIVDENVQFTVYRPKMVEPEKWHQLLAFAHLSEKPADSAPSERDPVDEVKQQARQVLGDKAAAYQPLTQDSRQAVPREGELTFVPDVPGVTFNPKRRTFTWLESVHREEFRFMADRELVGKTARGQMTVFLGTIILADIPLVFKVETSAAAPASPEPPLEPTTGKPYRKIFASYSHRDLPIVEQVEHYLQMLGDEMLRDWKHLRAGEVWSDGLRRLIDQADVFQLFWSENSMVSSFCKQEWEYALSLSRPHFIRPTYWQTPMPTRADPPLPPPELGRIHFQCINVAGLGERHTPAATTPTVAARPGSPDDSVTSAPVAAVPPRPIIPPPPLAFAPDAPLMPPASVRPAASSRAPTPYVPPPAPRYAASTPSVMPRPDSSSWDIPVTRSFERPNLLLLWISALLGLVGVGVVITFLVIRLLGATKAP